MSRCNAQQIPIQVWTQIHFDIYENYSVPHVATPDWLLLMWGVKLWKQLHRPGTALPFNDWMEQFQQKDIWKYKHKCKCKCKYKCKCKFQTKWKYVQKTIPALPFGILKQMQATVPCAARMFSIHILQIDVQYTTANMQWNIHKYKCNEIQGLNSTYHHCGIFHWLNGQWSEIKTKEAQSRVNPQYQRLDIFCTSTLLVNDPLTVTIVVMASHKL